MELPAPVHRVAPVRPTPVTPEPLVFAEPRFVAEPREPAQPNRPPEWLRQVQLPPAPEPLRHPSEPMPSVLSFPPVPQQTPQPQAHTPEPAPKPRPRRNLGQSRRLGLGAPIPQVPSADDEEEAEPEAAERLPSHEQLVLARPTTERVPADLAADISAAHGTDVSDVIVHRGPEVSAEAASRGTRAFTRDGEVHLPAEAGPIDAPEVRGLLGHELTHVVQQRTLGTSLPAENSPHGIALELQAVQGAEWAAGRRTQPPELRHVAPRQDVGRELVRLGIAHYDGEGAITAGPSLAASGAVQHELPHDKIREIARELAASELKSKDGFGDPTEEQLTRWFEIVREAGGVTAHVGMDDQDLRVMARKLVEVANRVVHSGRPPEYHEVDEMHEVLKSLLSSTSADSGAHVPVEYKSWGELRRGALSGLLGATGLDPSRSEVDSADRYLGKGMGKVGLGRFWSAPELDEAPQPTETPDSATKLRKPGASWTAPWSQPEVPEGPEAKEISSWGELMGRAGSTFARSLFSTAGMHLTEDEDRTVTDMASHPGRTANWLRDNASAVVRERSAEAWKDWEPSPHEETERAVENAKLNNGKNEFAELNFDELFQKIYQRVRSALREDLIVGHERAGRLSGLG
ncbi:DUF4157 domain-containing protein [Allokutzneria sp. NRRL B-24872]|uniref:eCIS core domain-containing protein n=1 Tax=Allokutzneria sp. NRRL B-24872 TaxID=1137961 RepID=UPI00143D90A5|nr:DUF4157 domain-containing protein [Allokutzneria sp. NRRL B-24872]